MPELLTRALEVLLFTLGGLYQGLRQDWNIVELLALGAFAFAVRRSTWVRFDFLSRAEQWGTRVARRRWRLCFGVGFGFVLLRVALLPMLPAPKPVVSDEFSHLLLADTLAHGRTSNPEHLLSDHFESLHLLVRPRYVSNYFPGQGAALAIGLWAGSAWAAVLVLSGICAGVFCWSMLGWMPARWAALGALLTALRFGVGSYWVNAYHGGFLAAIGGALVAGAYPRLQRSPLKYSVVSGVGLVILAYTRPYEGLAFATVFLAGTLVSMRRAGALRRPILSVQFLIPVAGAAGLTWYFWSITGSPTMTPYQISQHQYGWPMTFAWSQPPVIEHRHPELRDYYEYELDEHRKVDTALHFIQYLTFRLQEYWRFYYGPALTGCLLGSVWLFRRRRFRPLIWATGATLAAVLLEGAASPHYLAPAAMPVMAVIPLSIWRLRQNRTWGVGLSRLAVGLMAIVLIGRIAAERAGLPYTQSVNFQSWCCKVQGRQDKSALTAHLQAQRGRHIVLVKRKTDPYDFFQWVYNGADIDNSEIIWARDLGPGKNAALLEYYRNRTAWEVDPNVKPASIRRIR